MASSVFSRTTRRRPTALLFLPSRISLGLYGCWAHRKGWREGLLWTAPLCGEAKSKLCPELVSDVECSAAPEPGVGKFRFSRGTEFVGLGDDDAPFFGLMRKAVFYQRTAGSSSTKEPQEAPRESQCVQRIFPLERRCNRSLPARTCVCAKPQGYRALDLERMVYRITDGAL